MQGPHLDAGAVTSNNEPKILYFVHQGPSAHWHQIPLSYTIGAGSGLLLGAFPADERGSDPRERDVAPDAVDVQQHLK